MRDLGAGAVAEAQAAHATASQDPTRRTKTFLREAAPPAVQELNGAGALTLLQAMHRIVNAVRLALVGPVAALYGLCMGWRTSNQAGRLLSMGNALRLTGEGSTTAVQNGVPVLLH